MANHCRVTGCSRTTAPYSNLCARHVGQQRRWGDIRQLPFGHTEFKNARLRAEKTIDALPHAAKTWQLLIAVVEEMKAEAIIKSQTSFGAARFHVSIRRVFEEVAPKDIICAAIGFGLALMDAPQRFVSDKAYFMTVGRRMYGLAPSHYSASVAGDGKSRRSLREKPPRWIERIGRHFAEVFAPLAIQIFEQVRKREKGVEGLKREALAAIRGENPND